MSYGAGDVVTVIETDGTIRAARALSQRRADVTTDVVSDVVSLTLAIQEQSKDIDTLFRKSPPPRKVFRVAVTTGGSYMTARLIHNMGSNVLVRLEGTESEYAGTLAPAINYQTDVSDDTTAVVHIAQSVSVAYTAVIGIEAV